SRCDVCRHGESAAWSRRRWPSRSSPVRRSRAGRTRPRRGPAASSAAPGPRSRPRPSRPGSNGFPRSLPGARPPSTPVGRGEGQRRFLAQAVDFGASDAALSDEQIASARAGASLVPVTAGIVVLAYNLPGLGGPLKLPRDVYVDMFAGRIRMWNDARLVAANPGLALPARSIALVARQDASGTTFAMTNHLRAV